MNNAAKELITALRENHRIRQHFNMGNWRSKTCGTVGCLAGTAIGMGKWKIKLNSVFSGKSIQDEAREILGLSRDSSISLFIPTVWISISSRSPEYLLDAIPANQRPSLNTVEEMVKFANSFRSAPEKIYSFIGPDQAANALEATLTLHPDYVNWHKAITPKEMA